MKTMIRLAILVALFCAFQPNQASAQVNPHPQTIGVFMHFFWGGNHPLSDPTGQGTYISFYISDGVSFDLPVGASRSEVNDLLGGPFYTSILVYYGVIDFDSNGNVIPGENAILVTEEELAKAAKAPIGEGG